MIKYRLGRLDDGETRWLNQYRNPCPGEVVEVWRCDPDGTPIVFEQAVAAQERTMDSA